MSSIHDRLIHFTTIHCQEIQENSLQKHGPIVLLVFISHSLLLGFLGLFRRLFVLVLLVIGVGIVVVQVFLCRFGFFFLFFLFTDCIDDGVNVVNSLKK